ncbi:MAG: hypothetical protein D6790_17160 [Caldilineae bacterium]|nr:MAG: hypothetical protein D6790_17160 [Caldilineae bacterium]
MNQPSHEAISDELLSAYIDGAVTVEERRRVEAALRTDPQVAWRHESLRQTVALLRSLPQVPAPRPFTVTEAQVADVLARRRSRSQVRPSSREGWWAGFLAFLNSGNLALRNAAAVAAALFVILAVTGPFLRGRPAMQRAPEPVAAELTAPETAGVPAQAPAPQAAPQEQAAPVAIAPRAPEAPAAVEEAAPPVAPAAAQEAAPFALEPAGGEGEAPAPEARGLRQPEGTEKGDGSEARPAQAFAAPAAVQEGPGPVTAAALDLTPAEESAAPAPAAEALPEPTLAPTATPLPAATATAEEAVAVVEEGTGQSQPAFVPESEQVEAAPRQRFNLDLWLALQLASLAFALLAGALWARSRQA